jgi:hypothetical protein
MMALLLLALAADVSGIWVGQVPARNGDKLDVAFQFKQSGASVLTGKLYGDYRSTPLLDGKVSDSGEVTFSVLAEEQAGNQINDSRLTFRGVVKDGEIELTRRRENSTAAGTKGAAPARNADPGVTFRLKKLL